MKEVNNILENLKSEGNFRALQNLKHDDIYVIKDDKRLLNLCSNDYLNIANNENLKDRFLQKLDSKQVLFGAKSSRILGGNHEAYIELESLLKGMFHKEALLFNSGYHLNVSCLQALGLMKNILFVADKYIHASAIDGIRLSGAKMKRFLHNDMADLESILDSNHDKYDLLIIVSEGLFSMDGDFAKLDSIIKLKNKYENIMIYLDEAHSIGIVGDDGLGVASMYGYIREIDFLVLTFGKAISSMGAAMLTSMSFRDFFINKARGFIYSTAMPPINAMFSTLVFSMLKDMRNERERLESLSKFFKNSLYELGLNVMGDLNIISLVIGDNFKTLEISKKLEEKGFFAPAIRTPTVPPHSARIRFSLHSGLCREDLERLVCIIKNIYSL